MQIAAQNSAARNVRQRHAVMHRRVFVRRESYGLPYPPAVGVWMMIASPASMTVASLPCSRSMRPSWRRTQFSPTCPGSPPASPHGRTPPAWMCCRASRLWATKTDKSQTEHISSGLPPRADVGADIPISSRWARGRHFASRKTASSFAIGALGHRAVGHRNPIRSRDILPACSGRSPIYAAFKDSETYWFRAGALCA
jgi:hypothetical protein